MADGESKPKHKPKANFDARATAEMEQHLAVPDWSLCQKLALTARMLAREEHGSALAGQITARGDDPATLWTARFGLLLCLRSRRQGSSLRASLSRRLRIRRRGSRP